MRFYFLIPVIVIVIAAVIFIIVPEVSVAGEIDQLLEQGSDIKNFISNPFGGLLQKFQNFNEWSRNEVGIDFIKLSGWAWKMLKSLFGFVMDLIQKFKS